MKSLLPKLLLFLILLLGFYLRHYNWNWDQGFHLHPDERMLIMVAEKIHFWDNLNPHFFNYGSLPIYILKGTAQLGDFLFHKDYDSYDGMLKVGRFLSALVDTFTIVVVYKIANLLLSQKSKAKSQKHKSKVQNGTAGGGSTEEGLPARRYFRVQGEGVLTESTAVKFFPLFAAFFYAISFFPIQNSHFFVVDVFLTFFITLVLYFLLRYLKTCDPRHIIPIGIALAAACATKITAVIFIPFIMLVIILTLSENVILNLAKSGLKDLSTRLFVSLRKTISHLCIFIIVTALFTFFFMPYGILDYQEVLKDLQQQTAMRTNPYIFPFTLQYVGTIPYWYYLKNIFLWGVGPVVGILSLIGMFQLIINNYELRITNSNVSSSKFKYHQLFTNHYLLLTIFLIFYLYYFLLIGNSAVKFMRYMLPLYPFIAILAGYGLSQFPISDSAYRIKNNLIKKLLAIRYSLFVILLAILWTSMFVNIYTKKHTRISASEWIVKNIPQGSHVAVEHWDDRLPIFGSENYQIQEMTLYEQPDDEMKWNLLNQKLIQTDYMIIASNRLYTPLQRLDDCEKYRACYPRTKEYYQRLLNGLPLHTDYGSIQFIKVAEFESYPYLEIPFLNYELQISDHEADESFTVYDHPKIMIFKKI
ncbi:MAG TPA: glycosyltransferase family 39 protein [Candidatus Nitrosocosmicus sp.]|nr:glycosyltransferase family 39 protein [Candidatus Nitrosocosmicus sp.]